MISCRMSNRFLSLLAASLAALSLNATEHHGTVKSGGLPLPGVTITATQGDRKITTTTDERGFYSFPDLADGVWKLQIDMFGFVSLNEEVAIVPNGPSPEWNLKLLPLAALKEQLAPPKPAASPTSQPERRFPGRGNFPGR